MTGWRSATYPIVYVLIEQKLQENVRRSRREDGMVANMAVPTHTWTAITLNVRYQVPSIIKDLLGDVHPGA